MTTTNIRGEVTASTYDDANNRINVLLADGLTRTTVRNRAGDLITQIEANGATALSTTIYSYNAAGRLRMSTDPTGAKSYVLYDEAARKVADIEADGSLTEYIYNANNQVERTIAYGTLLTTTALASLVSGSAPANVALSSLRPVAQSTDRITWKLYDSANRLWREVDGRGNVVEYSYDGISRLVRTTAYANRVTAPIASVGPTATNTVPTANASADRVKRNLYDNDGLLRGTLDGEGYLTEYRYTAAGQKIQTLRYADATASADRNAGSLASLIANRAKVERAKDISDYVFYDSRGLIRAEINGEGIVTLYDHDQYGNLVRIEKAGSSTPPRSRPHKVWH